jgi:hypothetical protein
MRELAAQEREKVMEKMFLLLDGKHHSLNFVFFVLAVMEAIGIENKIKCIKAIRDYTVYMDKNGPGLKESKDLFEYIVENREFVRELENAQWNARNAAEERKNKELFAAQGERIMNNKDRFPTQ